MRARFHCYNIMKKFTLLIDESGDQGLDNLVTADNPRGASAYMTMGAALVYTDHLPQLRENLETERTLLDVKRLHCADLDHAKLSYISRRVSTYRLKLFGVISKKSTLGSYRTQITGGDQGQDYYNKCAQYLFERIGSFFGENQIQGKDVDIIFETKRNHDYFRLQRFLVLFVENHLIRELLNFNTLIQ